MSLYCVYRPPFSRTQPRVADLPEGLSLAEVIERMDLPRIVKEQGRVLVGGVEVPRGAWHLVRPKALVKGAANPITVHAPIMGGGGDSNKNPLAIIAGIGLTILSGGAAAGWFRTATGLFAAGSTSALFLAGGISLVGSLLLNALVPPPTLGRDDQDRTRRDASVRGNVLEPNGIVPRVVGQRRVFPPLLTEPLVRFDGEDEVVEAVYGLSGPHKLEDIQIGDAPASSIPGVEIEIREGWPGDRPLTLTRRYGRTLQFGQEVRGHQVSQDDGALLDPAVDVALAVPQAQVVATRFAPAVHELQIAFPQGLGRPSATDDLVRVPIRLRIRQRGSSTWRNLPEIHYQGADFRTLRATIALRWEEPAIVAPSVATSRGFVAAFHTTPDQETAPATDGWEADAYFYTPTGDEWMDQNNLGSTGVTHVFLSRDKAEFVLDPAEFTPGSYEIEIKRGCAFRRALFVSSAYTYGGQVRDFFAFFGTPPQIPFSREDLTDVLALQRSVSIWEENPVTTTDFALIALRARNQNIERLSVRAAGYVRDWDGTGWDEWTVTSNPAPHFRDVLIGAQNADPLPKESLDEDGLVEWRQACIDAGFTCDALVSDVSAGEAMSIIASCGYARPYHADVWGVVRDYDRSAESPVQIFTPRNSGNFRWSKAFRNLPDGLRVTYDCSLCDNEPRQISVFRPGISRDNGRMEQVRYEGLIVQADVVKRARYDLAQLEKRATLFNLDVGWDALVCRRGSLVGVVHDAVARNVGFARVVEGGTDRVTLDTAVPFYDEPEVHAVSNIYDVEDVWLLGATTRAEVRYPTGDVVTVDLTVNESESDVLEFADPQTFVPYGALVAIHAIVPEFRRMLVFDMQFRENEEATLTLVDEAPEIFAA